SYRMAQQPNKSYRLELVQRVSTDSEGIAVCLGLQAEAKVDLKKIIEQIQSKLSDNTRFEL
ncbi:MAG: hypothetical protein ABIF82_09275, partial [Planctomycetota bacterium]